MKTSGFNILGYDKYIFLDISEKITTKSLGYSKESLINSIVNKLSDLKIHVTVHDNKTILWKAPWPMLTLMGQLLWGLQGKIVVNSDETKIDIYYNISYMIRRILCLSFSFCIILLFLIKTFDFLAMIFFILFIWIFIYSTDYLITKLWFKGFINKIIHNLTLNKVKEND